MVLCCLHLWRRVLLAIIFSSRPRIHCEQCFLIVHVCRPTLPCLEQLTYTELLQAWQDHHQHSFHCTGAYVSDEGLELDGGSETLIVENLTLRCRDTLVSDEECQPLDDFLSELPASKAKPAPKLVSAASKGALSQVVDANPWVRE